RLEFSTSLTSNRREPNSATFTLPARPEAMGFGDRAHPGEMTISAAAGKYRMCFSRAYLCLLSVTGEVGVRPSAADPDDPAKACVHWNLKVRFGKPPSAISQSFPVARKLCGDPELSISSDTPVSVAFPSSFQSIGPKLGPCKNAKKPVLSTKC